MRKMDRCIKAALTAVLAVAAFDKAAKIWPISECSDETAVWVAAYFALI